MRRRIYAEVFALFALSCFGFVAVFVWPGRVAGVLGLLIMLVVLARMAALWDQVSRLPRRK